MTGYIIRRIGQSILVVLGVIFIMFILQSLLPDPARAILGTRASAKAIQQFTVANGFNQPIWVQFWKYLVQIVWHHNLGRSYKLNESVNAILLQDAPKTFLLVGVSFAIAIIIAIPIGVFQAVRRNRVSDHVVTGISFVLYSMPTFFFGEILIFVLAVQFHLFPAEAPQGATVGAILSQPAGLVLPMMNLVLINYAAYSRFQRSSAIEALAQDYIRTAKAKGLSNRIVLFRHMLRNALIPIATLVGLTLPAIFTAGLITEFLFNYPGMGSAYITALTTSDYPTALGITLVVAVATVIGNLFADVAYAALDPRVRY